MHVSKYMNVPCEFGEQQVDELVTVAKIRRALVERKADLRIANDDVARRRRLVERSMMTDGLLVGTEKDKARAIEWSLDDDQVYQVALRSVRDLEKKIDRGEAELAIALAGPRRDEWFIRDKLADAIMEYATRACMGVQEHALIDTAIDATDTDGVYAGNSRHLERARVA